VPMSDSPHPRYRSAMYAVDKVPIARMIPGVPLPQRLTWGWKRDYLSSRFMPRDAARMHRTIGSVRAMQVEDTTDAEALAEGIEVYEGYMHQEPALVSLERAWDQLHDKDGDRFGGNPCVFRYTLEEVCE